MSARGMRAGGWLRAAWAAGVVGCAVAFAVPESQAKTIIVRSDDAEAYFWSGLFRTFTDTLITNGIPQTIGVIPSHTSGELISDDTVMTAYLNSIKGISTVELALHGWQHSYYEFQSLTLAQAESKIASGLAVLQAALGVAPATFIPPQNAYNSNTLQACVNKGLTRFSAAGYNDPYAGQEQPAGLLHLPSTVDSQDWDRDGALKTSAAVIQECAAALASREVIVLQFHFWAFGDDNGALVPANYQVLLEIIGWLKQQAAQGVTLTTIGAYGRSVQPPDPPPVTFVGTNKTLIVRSDDAEAFFGLDLLRTVTDTVISYGVPHTLGVIPSHPSGELLSDDPDMVAYLNSIKGTTGVELALHGWQHSASEFAGLTLTQAQAKITSGLAELQSTLGIVPKTFIPPYNAFNSNTLQACVNKGLTRFSAASYSDPAAWTESPAGLLHVPSVVDFQDWNNNGAVKGAAQIIQECEAALALRDTVVLQIHFWAFGDSSGSLDPVPYQSLVDVLAWVRAQGDLGAKLKTIAAYAPPAPAVTNKVLTVAVAGGNDDAYEAGGTMVRGATYTIAGKSGSTVHRAGFRFASVKLPKTAKIVSAKLQLSYNWASGATDTILYGEAKDSSVAFTTTKNNLSGRTKTSAKVAWSGLPIASWGQAVPSPDITAIVQQIVSRTGWKSGNPITILQYESAATAKIWEAITYEGGASFAPKLVIEYQ